MLLSVVAGGQGAEMEAMVDNGPNIHTTSTLMCIRRLLCHTLSSTSAVWPYMLGTPLLCGI